MSLEHRKVPSKLNCAMKNICYSSGYEPPEGRISRDVAWHLDGREKSTASENERTENSQISHSTTTKTNNHVILHSGSRSVRDHDNHESDNKSAPTEDPGLKKTSDPVLPNTAQLRAFQQLTNPLSFGTSGGLVVTGCTRSATVAGGAGHNSAKPGNLEFCSII